MRGGVGIVYVDAGRVSTGPEDNEWLGLELRGGGIDEKEVGLP